MNRDVFPDITLQEMRSVMFRLTQGLTDSRSYWALGVLDATLMHPPFQWENIERKREYMEGYRKRQEQIRGEEA